MPHVVLQSPPPRRRRRWPLSAAALVAVMALVIVYGVPWWLGSGPGRRWLLDRAEQALRPGRLEVTSFSWSWFGPTRMRGFVLRDRQGEAVVTASEAVWDRTLWQAIFDKPHYGTLRLPGAQVDIERAADGTVDLFETLKPILTPNPQAQFVIRVENGSLRLRAPELETPLAGRDVALVIDRPVDPRPLTWQLRFNEMNPPAAKPRPGRFECEGQIDKAVADGERREIQIAVRTTSWPVNAHIAKGLTTAGTLDASTTIRRTEGAWHTQGKANMAALELSGPALRGDRPRFDKLDADWTLANDGGRWKVEALRLDAPGLKFNAAEGAPEQGGTKIRGEVDLAQLAAQIPKTVGLHDDLRLERGAATVEVTSRQSAEMPGATAWHVDAFVGDLLAHRGNTAIALKAPARLGADLRAESQRWVVERFELETSFLKAQGMGDVDRGIDLKGTIDLAALANEAGTLVDLGQWKPEGTGAFDGHYERSGASYVARLNLDLDHLKVSSAADDNAARVAASLPTTARVSAEVHGGADAAGWPTSWEQLAAKVESESLAAAIEARAAQGGVSRVTLQATPDITLGDSIWNSRVRIAAARDGASWDIAEARLELTAPAGQPGADSLTLALKGRYDSASDTLSLHSAALPDEASVLTLGTRGIELKDLRGAHWSLAADATLDLKQLDQLLAAGRAGEPMGIEGIANLSATARGLDDGVALRLDARSESAAVLFDAQHSFANNRTSVNQLTLSSEYGSIEARGTVDDLGGKRLVDLEGRIDPDWQRVNAWLAEHVEPGARVAGRGRDFHLRGSIDSADPAAVPLEGDLGVDLQGLDVYGMTFGPAPVVLRWSNGKPAIDPIDTSLNGGRVHLKPVLERRDEGASWALGLASGSGIENATVNDEVSHRVLAYVAPVLDRATRVNGAVSARFEEVSIPLTRTVANDTVVEGTIIFHDVAFEPGPMAMRLYDTLGMEPMSLRLDQPVLLAISDGVVHQRGFSLPLGNVARVLMDGDVGFDRSLALDVRIPMSGDRFANVPVFSRIAPAMRLEFPIRGTLDDPKIDSRAMGDAMKRVGLDVAQAAGFGGIEALVREMSTPRDPVEEARLKAEREERQRIRREKQQQKREEQRLKREQRKATRRSA